MSYPATNGHWHLYLIAADAGLAQGWATTEDPHLLRHPGLGLELRILHWDGSALQAGRPYSLRAGPNAPAFTYSEHQLGKKLAKIKTSTKKE